MLAYIAYEFEPGQSRLLVPKMCINHPLTPWELNKKFINKQYWLLLVNPQIIYKNKRFDHFSCKIYYKISSRVTFNVSSAEMSAFLRTSAFTGNR